VHIAFFAAKVKFTPEQIAATVRGTNAEWKEDERVLLDVCEEFDATRSISDDLWARQIFASGDGNVRLKVQIDVSRPHAPRRGESRPGA
jgi:hypothetical protein